MSGVVACFWQAFPNLTSTELRQRIRASADRYNNPDEQYGYGVPDFKSAYETVLSRDQENFLNITTIFPNPVNSAFTIKTNDNNSIGLSIKIYNLFGSMVFQKVNLKSNTIEVSGLSTGIYILKVTNGASQKTFKLVKN